ncbi:MAG: histidine ammonia-lyase [Steroidobacteraceae bacterium]
MIELDAALGWREVAAIAEGAPVAISDAAERRVRAARSLVESIVEKGLRAYGVNTGVGALCDIVVDASRQRQLSRNILMSHAVGVGAPLGAAETRAIIAAAINNFVRGASGVRLEVVAALVTLLNRGCLPEVPSRGSVGYLAQMAHIALVLIGAGHARLDGERCTGAEALQRLGVPPLVLEAKEGLSLVNGTPCALGLAVIALQRMEALLEWADAVAAMSFENLHGQGAAFDARALALRASPGLERVGANLRTALDGSGILEAAAGSRTQDALSLRAIPQVHGAVRDVFTYGAAVIDRELGSVTDNPIVTGTPEAPRVHSQAHAVGAAIGLAADSLGIAIAELAAMSERRIDRLVNPLVSGLPAFLAADSGTSSGFMIAQYTAVSLVAENRRLAAPASLDGGVTSGLQEDHLSHATPAASKWLQILENVEAILAIEALAAAQAYDLQPGSHARAPRNDATYRALRAVAAFYRDDRPLADDIARARALLRLGLPAALQAA